MELNAWLGKILVVHHWSRLRPCRLTPSCWFCCWCQLRAVLPCHDHPPQQRDNFPAHFFRRSPVFSNRIPSRNTCIYVLIPRYTNPRKRNTERKLRIVVTFTSWVDRIELYTDQRFAMLSPAVPPELLQLTSTFFFAVLLAKTRQRRKHCVSVEVKLLPVPPSRLHVRRLLKSGARNCALLDVLQSSPLVCRVATQAVQYARNSLGTRPIKMKH